MSRKKKIPVDSVTGSAGEKTGTSGENPAVNGADKKGLANAFFILFIMLIGFFLVTAWFSLKTNGFSLLLLLALALSGFMVAMLARRLSGSGYFQFYRIMAMAIFVPIAVVQFFRAGMNGFTYGLFGILAGGVLLSVVIPYFREGIKVERIALIALTFTMALGLIYMILAGSIIVPIEKAVSFDGIFPSGVVFDRESKFAWIYGDNRYLKSTPGGFTTFRLIKSGHPQVNLDKWQRQRDDSMNQAHVKDKNKKNAITEEACPSLAMAGEGFSYCRDRAGEKLAVGGSKLKDTGKNFLHVLNLAGMEKTEIKPADNIAPFFSDYSNTRPDYSTWNADGTKFFVFSINGDGPKKGYGLYIADIQNKNCVPIREEGVISACWTGKDEIRFVTGDSADDKKSDPFNSSVKNGAVYRAGIGAEPQLLINIDSAVQRIMVHPGTGLMIAFDGKNMGILRPGADILETMAMEQIPVAGSSIISPNGAFLAMESGGEVLLAELANGKIRNLGKPSGRVANLTLTPDSRYLIYSLSSNKMLTASDQIIIHDMNDGKNLAVSPNFLTGDYFSGRMGWPAINNQGFHFDPYKPAVYFDQISIKKPMDRSLEQSLWRIDSLY